VQRSCHRHPFGAVVALHMAWTAAGCQGRPAAEGGRPLASTLSKRLQALEARGLPLHLGGAPGRFPHVSYPRAGESAHARAAVRPGPDQCSRVRPCRLARGDPSTWPISPRTSPSAPS
jgi:hypothetical protein